MTRLSVGVSRVSATHTRGDISLELVEDLLDGLHVRLQVPGVLGHPGHGRGQHRAQVEVQDAVHGVARERALQEEETRGG